jgi:hypothetical protein
MPFPFRITTEVRPRGRTFRGRLGLVRERLRADQEADEEEDEELDRGDSRRDHGGNAPGLERLVLNRMIHGAD